MIPPANDLENCEKYLEFVIGAPVILETNTNDITVKLKNMNLNKIQFSVLDAFFDFTITQLTELGINDIQKISERYNYTTGLILKNISVEILSAILRLNGFKIG